MCVFHKMEFEGIMAQRLILLSLTRYEMFVEDACITIFSISNFCVFLGITGFMELAVQDVVIVVIYMWVWLKD